VEVFDSLPKEMQDAFESGDVAKLREFVNGLSMDEARHHMRRMVDAGLWVPKPGEEGSALQPGPDATEEDEEEEEEEEKDA
jgi:cell division cycle protein 37